jgi:hypothetical protein
MKIEDGTKIIWDSLDGSTCNVCNSKLIWEKNNDGHSSKCCDRIYRLTPYTFISAVSKNKDVKPPSDDVQI